MRLFYRSYGKGFPIVALHGLYASSDSWMNLVGELSSSYRLILVDQRNHGRSPHSTEHSYELMGKDLYELLDALCLNQVILLGHSMGGKTTMYFALRYPKLVKGLVVEDISPFAYPKNHKNVLYHKKIISSLQSLPLNSCKFREEVENILLQTIPDSALCKFLLKNLQRNQYRELTWRINPAILAQNLTKIMDDVTKGCTPINTPTLFIKGSTSHYITSKDENTIREFFPNTTISTIQNSGHWPHNEQQIEFLRTVKQYLSLLNSTD